VEANEISVDLKVYESGHLRAFADVTLRTSVGEITLKGYHVVANKTGDGSFVGPPSERYTNKTGEIKNKRIVEAGRAAERKIAEAVLDAYKKAVGK
jgi:DNA-binding cell septation regulator SpoVG